MNKIILTGNLTKDGEVRTTQSGKEVYSISLAVKRNFKNKDGEYETDFFEITKWNPTDYIKNNAKKGTKALINGTIYREEYIKDNEKKYIWKVLAEEVELFLGKKETQETTQEIPQNIKTDYQDKDIQINDDDLPF